ncbi:unnamed protein product [Effrenium voratum]|uniref:Uncharacterized protein n=1 Tax=Effrenium voratum TaxID=2562239 RepID=A0AA36J6Y2_9DINO|nr:unnamed protein product [Effrenium voratum]
MPATAIGTHVVWMSTCAMALSPEGAFQNDTRRLQAAHTFLMSELHCQSCCKEEWRSCLCILGCDVFQGQCDGVDAVESCDVLRRCYERVDELSPKGFDFVFQCKLMKCIAFCMNQEQVCAPIRNSFVATCQNTRESELECDVYCSAAQSLRAPLFAWLLLHLLSRKGLPGAKLFDALRNIATALTW